MIHLPQSTRMGLEEGMPMQDEGEIAALEALASHIEAPRKFPLSSQCPLSYWEGCAISVFPSKGPFNGPFNKGGRLQELIVKGAGLAADLAELAPLLGHLGVLEWLDLSENANLRGDVGHLVGCLATTCEGVDLHDTLVHGDMAAFAALADIAAREEGGEEEGGEGDREKEARGGAEAALTATTATARRRTKKAKGKGLAWLSVATTQVGGTLDCLVPATDAGTLRFIDVSHCANIQGALPARFERASKLTVRYAATELAPYDLVGKGEVMPGGYFPPSHPVTRHDDATLSVW